jgi:isoleucyl-tRNA synthetase
LDDGLAQEWERLLGARDEVMRALEAARKEKRIGSAQEAAVVIQAASPEFEFLAGHREDLETICIVSHLTVQRAEGGAAGQGLSVSVDRAAGQKCQRCWNYRGSVGASAAHPALCDRCVAVLETAH